MDLFRISFVGHVGNDAVVKTIADDKKVINFSVAVNQSYKDKNGDKVEKTVWVECALWNNEKIVKYLKKGVHLYIEGVPAVNAYSSKEGEPKASQTCKVENIQILSKIEGKEEE